MYVGSQLRAARGQSGAIFGVLLLFALLASSVKIGVLLCIRILLRVVLRSLVRRFTVEPIKESAKSSFQGYKCPLI